MGRGPFPNSRVRLILNQHAFDGMAGYPATGSSIAATATWRLTAWCVYCRFNRAKTLRKAGTGAKSDIQCPKTSGHTFLLTIVKLCNDYSIKAQLLLIFLFHERFVV